MQTAHQSSLGSSPFSELPLVSEAPAVLLPFPECNEVAEVVVEVEEVAAPEPLPEQGVPDWGSVLMRSPKALRASTPEDTSPNVGWVLLSGLLIMQSLLPSFPRSVFIEEVGQLLLSSVPGSCFTLTCSTAAPPPGPVFPAELQLPLLPVLDVLEGRAGVCAFDNAEDPGECVDRPGEGFISNAERCCVLIEM